MLDSHDTLSSILGWVSIACWIIVYSPQIYENYSNQSGEGLSISFVVIWLIGDLCNLVGAIIGGLLPTVIILALYYTVCDLILLIQIYYYRWRRSRQLLHPPEQQPLLHEPRPEHVKNSVLLARYTAALFFVVVVGVLAWWIRDVTNARPTPPPKNYGWEVQALGWTSAVLYLGARIPQINKNLKTRCEGLSPALFFFAIFGNVTFALSICAKGIDRQNLIANSGWLAGSALTVFLDVFVLGQIFYYRSADRSAGTSQ
ncbi:PQ loop repeat-domain-containing protein [Lyophyllum atratum]|nr:PQ loop repeat-domain-containing protein [Lyophyllum atratum]